MCKMFLGGPESGRRRLQRILRDPGLGGKTRGASTRSMCYVPLISKCESVRETQRDPDALPMIHLVSMWLDLPVVW